MATAEGALLGFATSKSLFSFLKSNQKDVFLSKITFGKDIFSVSSLQTTTTTNHNNIYYKEKLLCRCFLENSLLSRSTSLVPSPT